MDFRPPVLLKILLDEYGTCMDGSTPTEREKDLAVQISGIIQAALHSAVEFEEDMILDFEDIFFVEEVPMDRVTELADDFLDEVGLPSESEKLNSSESQQSSSSWKATPSTPLNRKRRNDIPFSKRKQAVDYWRSCKGKSRRGLKSMKARYRFVTSERQLEYWERQIIQDGSSHDKLCQIAINVRKKVLHARTAKNIIHDDDIRRWALVENRNLNVPNFKASKEWIRRFKKSIGVRSKKVTRFVSRVTTESNEDIVSSARNFVSSIVPEISTFLPENVYNSDQSGFNLEMHGGRTLDFIGTRRVEAHAQSVSATTHSYTIMPTLSAAGKLLSPLVIVFKEANGKFGTTVKDTMLKPANILSIAAKSSIMGKLEIRQWYDEAFLPNCSESSLLLVDSLRAYSCVADSNKGDKTVAIRTIPPHATGLAQPLDVYFFRVWKSFARKVSEFIILENADIFLRQRNNIIRLQSLIHNQLSAPMFLTFRLQAWYKSGYLLGEAPQFVHPINYCFMSDDLYCTKCEKLKLLKCSWCGECLCIDHAFKELHFHPSD